MTSPGPSGHAELEEKATEAGIALASKKADKAPFQDMPTTTAYSCHKRVTTGRQASCFRAPDGRCCDTSRTRPSD